MRFRPEQHLRRQSDIRVVREQGRRVDCRAFTVWWKHRDIAPELTVAPHLPRVCVIASTAAVGNAVRRNRAKRRMRAAFDKLVRLNPTAEAAGLVVAMIAWQEILDKDFKAIEKSLRAALRQAGVRGLD